MKFIAIKTEDGTIKGKLSFYCRMFRVSRQGFYKYLSNKDRPWKYQPLAADGQKRQKIEIVYNFIGSVELPEEAVAADSVTIELPQPKGTKRKKPA